MTNPTPDKERSWSDYSAKEQKEILEKAARKSNKDQQKYLKPDPLKEKIEEILPILTSPARVEEALDIISEKYRGFEFAIEIDKKSHDNLINFLRVVLVSELAQAKREAQRKVLKELKKKLPIGPSSLADWLDQKLKELENKED